MIQESLESFNRSLASNCNIALVGYLTDDDPFVDKEGEDTRERAFILLHFLLFLRRNEQELLSLGPEDNPLILLPLLRRLVDFYLILSLGSQDDRDFLLTEGEIKESLIDEAKDFLRRFGTEGAQEAFGKQKE